MGAGERRAGQSDDPGGLVIVTAMIAMALLAPVITVPNTPDPYQMPRDWLAARVPPGTPGHFLGTTNRGGDVLYGVIWGARTSLRLSLMVVSLTAVIGVIIGSIAGFIGGRVDEILMRIVDVFLSIPELIFALAIAAVLGPSFTNIILALVVVFWVKYARIMRAQICPLLACRKPVSPNGGCSSRRGRRGYRPAAGGHRHFPA